MKFKFLLAALAISTFMCVPAQAQDDMETRHEVAVSYGTLAVSKHKRDIELIALNDLARRLDGKRCRLCHDGR